MDIRSDPQLTALLPYLISLSLGLLLGIERERNPYALAGLRTFALTALLGCLMAQLASTTGHGWLLAAGLLVVGLFIVTAYFNNPQPEPGTTTEVALVLVYALGALIYLGQAQLAVMLGVIISALLYFKPELRNLSARLNRHELMAIIQFAALAFVVLPILPEQHFGPYGAFTPKNAWMVVVLISGLNLAGFVALKFFGTKAGAPLLGLLGGLVSSTATTITFSRSVRIKPELTPSAALIIALANTIVPLRLAGIVAVLAPGLLPLLLVVFAPAVLSAGIALVVYWRKQQAQTELPALDLPNPANLSIALWFAALYSVILLVTAALTDWAGRQGLFFASFTAGLTDVDAITLSSIRLFGLERFDAHDAALSISLALLANTLFKIGLMTGVGGKALLWQARLPVMACLLGTLVGLALLAAL